MKGEDGGLVFIKRSEGKVADLGPVVQRKHGLIVCRCECYQR